MKHTVLVVSYTGEVVRAARALQRGRKSPLRDRCVVARARRWRASQEAPPRASRGVLDVRSTQHQRRMRIAATAHSPVQLCISRARGERVLGYKNVYQTRWAALSDRSGPRRCILSNICIPTRTPDCCSFAFYHSVHSDASE